MKICPDCGGRLEYYHSFGDGITKVICKNKCKGWKVLQEIDRKEKERSGEGEL